MSFSGFTKLRAKSLVFLAIILAATGTLNGLTVAGSLVLTFAPVADASIRLDKPTTNLGRTANITVDSSPKTNFLIKFNVTGVGSGQVASASLRLFQTDSSNKGGDFRKAPTNWSETTVTWNTAPAADPVLIASLGRVSKGTWYEVDLTPAIQADGLVSLRVNSTSSDGAYYSSREGGNPPQLILTVNPSSPDTSPPTQPQGLIATPVSSNRVDLSWEASNDDVGVTGYDVFRNGAKISTVATTADSDLSVASSTTYNYTVVAFDASGKRSLESTGAIVTTPPPEPVSSIVLIAIEDSYIRADNPTASFGSAITLAVDASPLRDILLKFNVSGVGGGQVQSAKLRLFQTDASPRGGDIRKLVSTWSEGTVNWNNAPTADPAIIASIGQVSPQVWYEADVTSAVAGDGLISFRISSPNTDGAIYSSSEGANPPRLNVTYSTLPQPNISLQTQPNPSSVGAPVAFSGTLSNSTGGRLPNRAVEIQSLASNSWITIASATTAMNGSYTVNRTFSSAGTYKLRTLFAGDSTHRAGSTSALNQNVTGTNSAGFTFSASGDHDAQPETDASLQALTGSGSSFYLALGDLSYGALSPESAWCNYVTSYVGAQFPFELLSGNHEDGEEEQAHGLIDNFAACLPDRIGTITGTYAKEYYFDYPASTPLARFIMTSPDLNFTNGGYYSYRVGTFHYNWLAGVIDGARAVGIPWVIVGMHKVCLSLGTNSCEVGKDLMNLLIEKKVDLVLQGHSHTYQRSAQLAHSSACTTVPVAPNPANTACISDTGSDGVYTKGSGTVFIISGIFGSGLTSVNASDIEAPYFSNWFGSNSLLQGHGFVKYTVSATGIAAELVLASGGPFPDRFSLASAESDTTPPSQPQNLTAAAISPSQVNLSWQASTDDFVVAGYEITRNGTNIASVGGVTTTYADTTVSSPAAYVYTVVALDAAGNPSVPSGEARIRLATMTFLPTDDAYILAVTTTGVGGPNTNFGSGTELKVDTSPLREFLLKFNVTGVGTTQVVNAKLRLFQVDSSPSGGDFYTTSTDWSEETVTWNNAPQANGTRIAFLGRVSPSTWYEVDLTVAVGGDGVISLRVLATNSDGAIYSSKEGAAPPQLVIVVSTTF